MIDMESHGYVDATLEVVRARARAIPSTWASRSRRTCAGAPRTSFALPAGCRVRLVKGAYLEPDDVVFDAQARGRRELRAAVRDAARAGPSGRRRHARPGADRGRRATRVDALEDGWSRVEFQMLYGVRRDLQAPLARRGVSRPRVHPVRHRVVPVPHATAGRAARQPVVLPLEPGEDVDERAATDAPPSWAAARWREALIYGLIRSGGRTADEIMVTCRREERARELAGKYGVTATLDNAEAARWANVLVLMAKPQDIEVLLEQIREPRDGRRTW